MLLHDPWRSCWRRPAAAPGAWQGAQAGKAGHGLPPTNRAALRAFACARRTGSDSHWTRLCLACLAFVTPDMPSHATHLTLWPGGDVNLARGLRKRFEKREVWQLGFRATCVGWKPADSYRAVPKLPSSAHSSNLAFYSLNNAKGWQRILRMLCSGFKSPCTCACILMQLSLHKLLSPI
jgi:hypothetical protein